MLNNRKKISNCVILSLLLISMLKNSGIQITNPNQPQKPILNGVPKISATHDPISISGNNWTTCDVVTGNGTQGDPYTIVDLIIDAGGSDGIHITGSDSYGIIRNCTIFNADYGIYIGGSSKISLIDNNVTNSFQIGISIDGSPNCTLTGNKLFNDGIMVQAALDTSLDQSNTVNGAPIYYFEQQTVDFNGGSLPVGQVILNQCENGTVQNANISHSDFGIYLYECVNITLKDNSVSEASGFGIPIIHSFNCTMKNNNISNTIANIGGSGTAIFILQSDNCTLDGNTAFNSSLRGVNIFASSNCTIVGNKINRNQYGGLQLTSSSNDTYVHGNHFIKNGGEALNNYGGNNDIKDNIFIDYLNVSFTSTRTSLLIGEFVNFTDTSIEGNPIFSYYWNFGDGTYSTLQNSTHSYMAAGNYTVTLTVTDSDEDSDEFSVNITVNEDLHPNALFTVSTDGAEVDESIDFTDTSTGGNAPLYYLWQFGDGSSSTEKNPSHTYSTAGTYTINLTVVDSDGDFDSYTLVITINSPSNTSTTNATNTTSPGFSVGGIPGYSTGFILLSAGLVIFLILKRKLNK